MNPRHGVLLSAAAMMLLAAAALAETNPTRPDLDYGALRLPNCEAICNGEGGWLYQSVLLAAQADMDDVIAAFQKVYDNRVKLAQSLAPAGVS